MTNRTLSSRSIRLGSRLLAATAAVSGAVVLQGCTPNLDNSAVYKDPQDCVAGQMFTAAYCAANFKTAQAEHVKRAPHYMTKKDCEDDWSEGQCDQYPNSTGATAHGGGVYYTPRMGGYWMGYTQDYNGKNAPAAPRKDFTYPVYKDKEGNIYSPATDQSLDGYGRAYSRPDAVAAHTYETAPRPTFGKGGSYAKGSIGRGGFGSIGRGGLGFGAGE